MCGLVGVWESRGDAETRRARVERMARLIAHRGPDGAGAWVSPTTGIGLGHARLAILDVSDRGAQPMRSPDGRYTLVYNGEVYNHLELRSPLEAGGRAFRSGTDTETVLAAFERWGVEEALPRFNGMFAFALWDARERQLVLGRDRLGIKPLYVGTLGGTLVFGSDLAMLRDEAARLGVAPEVVRAYLRFGCVPDNACIFRGFRKVRPGTTLRLSSPQLGEARERAFWQVPRAIPEELGRPLPEVLDEVEQALARSVRRRLLADVPLGAFLSGGIDSSLVVALMQRASSSPVHTFSIGFEEARFDESSEARRVAEALGTDHRELRVSAEQCLEVIPRLPTIYSEPFADSSQIPTVLVAELARSDVTVALTGDGGDEVFAGYNRHVWGPRVWSARERLPRPVRRLAGRGLSRCASLAHRLEPLLRGRVRLPEEKLEKLGRALCSDQLSALYGELTACWVEVEAVAPGPEWRSNLAAMPPSDPTRAFQVWDLEGYLQHDILTKVDRATMAVGLEGRVPFLDHQLVELALRLPTRLHVRDRKGKALTRALLARHLPSELFERPKAGFAVPIGEWLRGPLRPWAESLMDDDRLEGLGLRVEVVAEAWRRLLEGEPTHHRVWAVLMLSAWAQDWRVA